MALQPIYLAPGIDKTDSSYSDQQTFWFVTDNSEASRIGRGRYIDSQWTRFISGFPEKIGGYSATTITGLEDIPRQIMQINQDGTDATFTITETHLYAGTTDITPPAYQKSGLGGPSTFEATSGSAHVTITSFTISTEVTGNIFLNFQGSPPSWAGLTFPDTGYYPIVSIAATTVTILFTATATSTANQTGVGYIYALPNYLLGSNPFTTVLNSATVTVTDTTTGLVAGQYVTYSGATAVNGITISGEYKIVTKSSGSYTITAGNVATGNGSGGGSVVLVTYLTPIDANASGPVTPQGGQLAQYGDWLLALWPATGQIYQYGYAQPVTLARAFQVLNSPFANVMFVTPERYLVALTNIGISSGRANFISWADQNDITDWTPSATNTAQSNIPVVSGSQWTAGFAVRDFVSLISTDKAVFSMTYTTDSAVYDIALVGDNCGVAGLHACTKTGEDAVWLGNGDIWSWNGSVGPVSGSDDIRDYLFRNINPAEFSKIFLGKHSLKKEIWGLFPSSSATENDSYFIYHEDQKVFSVGQLGTFSRTCWCDNTPNFTPAGPLTADTSGTLWQMDTGTDIVNAGTTAIDAWVTTSFVELSNGDTNLDLTGFILDTERQSGTLELTLLTQYYPEDTATSTGPESIAPGSSRVDLRLDGRIAAFKLESNAVGGDFRMGLCRMDIKPSGARR